MRYLWILIILLWSVPTHAKTFGDYAGAVYLKNYDGDTITFNLPRLHPIIGDKISIQVKGIDTPGIKSKCPKGKALAKETKEFVHNTLKSASQINLKNLQRSKYFRIVADVVADGQDLGKLLIENGYAVKYHSGKKRRNWCY